MKKLLIFISILLCLSMLFVSCTDKNVDDEEEEYAQPVDNVEDNVNMLIKELNKAETLQDLVNSSKTVVDGQEIVSELRKISAAGKMSLTGYMDGKKEGKKRFGLLGIIKGGLKKLGDSIVGQDFIDDEEM